jgi:hypothetical protein
MIGDMKKSGLRAEYALLVTEVISRLARKLSLTIVHGLSCLKFSSF